MPEPEDDENDMLDLAFGLTETFEHLTQRNINGRVSMLMWNYLRRSDRGSGAR